MSFSKFAYFAWAVGAVLVALSHLEIVDAEIGWYGFYAAIAGIVVHQLAPRGDSSGNEQAFALLSSVVANTNKRLFDEEVDAFVRGKPLWFDGVCLYYERPERIRLAIVTSASPHEVSEESVKRDRAAAMDRVAELLQLRPDLRERLSGQKPPCDVVAIPDDLSRVICTFDGDEIAWFQRSRA